MRLIKFLFVLGLVSITLPQAAAWAVVVASFGGNYVSSSQNLNGATTETTLTGVNLDDPSRDNRVATIPPGDTTADDMLGGIPFSSVRVLNPTSNYTGPTFYGGAVHGLLNTSTNVSFADARVQNSGNNDVIDIRFQQNNTASDVHFAVFFQQADFLNGADTANYRTLGAGDTFSVTTDNSNSAQISDFGELRWIIKADGQWWISAQNADGDPNIRPREQVSTEGIKNQTTYTSSFDAGELSYWAPYNPTDSTTSSGLNMNFEPNYDAADVGDPISFNVASGTFTQRTFTNITAVGLYIEDDQFTNNVLQFTISAMSFNLHTSAVPEPGVVLLLGVAGLGAIWWRRRTKKPGRSTASSQKEARG